MRNIIMDFTSMTIRTALVEDGKLIEVLIDDTQNSTSVGNIYAGKVENIFNQFAFIEIGKEKKSFLQLDDIRQRAIYKEVNGKKKLNINMGQQLVVQVLKDEIGEKGATVTTELSFTGKYIVLIKIEDNKMGSVFVSKKIEEADERKRLNKIATASLPLGYSIIIRTDCTGVNQENIIEEINNLYNISHNLISRSAYIKPPALLYSEANIYSSSLKSLLKENIDNIIINSDKEFENVKTIAKNYFNNDVDKVKLYQGELNIFDEYEIESQIEKTLNKKVWLKSGGFIVIEETEACVVIDVNTGKHTAKKNKDDIILKNNKEAATEISKQLRLRNLSGIIIVDFIDMKSEIDKQSLMSHLHKVLKEDRVGVNIVGMTSLGLVQLTRKKTRKPLSQYLTCECDNCKGIGKIQSVEYIIDRIYKQTYRILKQTIFNSITININPKVYKVLKDRNDDFNKLEQSFNATIEFKKINTQKLDYFEIEKEKK